MSSGTSSASAAFTGFEVIAPKRAASTFFSSSMVRGGKASPSRHQNSQPMSPWTYSASSSTASSTMPGRLHDVVADAVAGQPGDAVLAHEHASGAQDFPIPRRYGWDEQKACQLCARDRLKRTEVSLKRSRRGLRTDLAGSRAAREAGAAGPAGMPVDPRFARVGWVILDACPERDRRSSVPALAMALAMLAPALAAAADGQPNFTGTYTFVHQKSDDLQARRSPRRSGPTTRSAARSPSRRACGSAAGSRGSRRTRRSGSSRSSTRRPSSSPAWATRSTSTTSAARRRAGPRRAAT